MNLEENKELLFAAGSAFITILVGYFIFQFLKKPKEEEKISEITNEEKTTKSLESKKKKIKPSKVQQNQQEPSHPLLLFSLKNSGEVTTARFSPNGERLVTFCRDRSWKIFPVKELKGKSPRIINLNLRLDYASACCFSKDSNKVVVAFGDSKEIVTFELLSKEMKEAEGKSYKEISRFSTKHKETIKSLSLSDNMKFILSCTEETTIKLWDLKGKLLQDINTNQLKNNMASLAPNSKFLSVAAWTGDARVWEIKCNKNDEFEKVNKIIELKGHKSSISSVCFNSDSTRIVTTSKDCTWKIWKIDIQYQIGEDPQCILTVQSPQNKVPFHLASISPDDKLVALAMKNSLYFYDLRGKEIVSIDNIHPGSIAGINWHPDSSCLLTHSEEGKLVKIWKNPTWAN